MSSDDSGKRSEGEAARCSTREALIEPSFAGQERSRGVTLLDGDGRCHGGVAAGGE